MPESHLLRRKGLKLYCQRRHWALAAQSTGRASAEAILLGEDGGLQNLDFIIQVQFTGINSAGKGKDRTCPCLGLSQ